MHGVLHTAVDRRRIVQHVFEAVFRPATPDQLVSAGIDKIEQQLQTDTALRAQLMAVREALFAGRK